MANTFKKVIDRQMWLQTTPSPNAHAAGGSICSDLRSDVSRNPFIYQLVSNTVLNRFNIVTKSWSFLQSPALAGTFGVGSCSIYTPSQGLVGSIGTGATTTMVPTTTAIKAVGLNMLANRGGSGEYGFKIRIIGKAAGKTEERYIVANTEGTTPTYYLDNPLTFTPAENDRYEILSGRVFMLGAGTKATNIWRSLELACNDLSVGLDVTALPATIGTDTALVALDEQYTPYDMKPGEGMVKGSYKYDENLNARYALTATAADSSTITGQLTGGDAVVAENEYRNYQIRIVEDTVNTTAVGQRRIIASHTAGASPVYTLGTNWTVTPSATAKYVIELPNIILARTSATTTVYTYNYNDDAINNGTNTINANTWSTTYFSAAPAANAVAGHWAVSYGIQPDVARLSRQSFCYFFRGGTATTLDVLDIAGSATGTWTANIIYDGATAFTTGTCGCTAPFENEGRFHYMNYYVASATNQIFRFDVQNRVLAPTTATDLIQAGTAAAGKRMVTYAALDGADTYDVVLLQSHLSTLTQELMVMV